MHIEKHANGNEEKRITAYYRFIGDLIKKGLYYILGRKTVEEKSSTVAEKLVDKWNNSESHLKKLMNETAKQKIKED